MKIGLIDVDNWGKLNKCFPNISLMKISAFYKKQGYCVEWYDLNTHYDIVYMSKVFSFSSEPFSEINADVVVRGGSGYAIRLIEGKEVFDKKNHRNKRYSLWFHVERLSTWMQFLSRTSKGRM